MKRISRLVIFAIFIQAFSVGCVSHVYKPGAQDNPFNRIKLGQSYGEMVNILGEPDHSRTEDRMTEETILLFTPIWGIVEFIGDFNPSAMQVYTYDRFGSITIDNNNRVIRVEAK